MPERTESKTIFSLLEVTQSIQRTLSSRYTSVFWVKAEMNKLNYYPQSGHCYPELVEKRNGKVITQLKAMVWSDDFVRINDKFQNTLKEPLKNGIKILFCAKIIFDPVHGLSLRILDIDPAYTLGDLEQEKLQTLETLNKEGLFYKNKNLTFPLLPQRLAIISVETSKGYADFLKVIDENPWQYKFFHVLFPALLQGERAVESIIRQLHRIHKVRNHFDVVAIIRGGGGDIGLSCYNHYQLAKAVATFPLPVITGIGHATNETVVEMLSFQNAITPTKLAEFLIQKFHDYAIPVKKAEEKLVEKSRALLLSENTRLYNSVKFFRSITENMLMRHHNHIQKQAGTLLHQSGFLLKQGKNEVWNITSRLNKSAGKVILSNNLKAYELKTKLSESSQRFLKTQNIQLNNLEKNVNNMHPESVLKRGYSISLLNGKAVKSFEEIKEGDTLQTKLFTGSLTSRVTSVSGKDPEPNN